MMKARNRFIKNLRYLCLIGVIGLGLMTIVGTGGGGGGGGTSVSTDTGDTDQTDTDTGGETTPPVFSGFDFTLSEGDFWEFQWDYYKNSWAQGSSGSTTRDSGTFRVTLGSTKEIDGVTAYEVQVTGKSGLSDKDFAPRWKYFAVNDNQILGSEDGTTLVTLFDAQNSAWPGAGFFTSISSSALVTGNEGQIDNDYITESCIVVSQSDSESQCEYFPGIGTICGDSSYTWTEKEYYKEGIGAIGYYYYNSFSDCGGGFCSGATWTQNVGLVASSLRGDTVDYELETEPNDSPDTAHVTNLPANIKGSCTVNDEGTVFINEFPEAEQNDTPQTAQNLGANASISGDIEIGDEFTWVTYKWLSQTYQVGVEDWYKFSLTSASLVSIELNYDSSPNAEIWLFLFRYSSTTDMGTAVGYKAGTDTTKQLSYTLDPGDYLIAIVASVTPGRTNYTLKYVEGHDLSIEDWYTFTLTSQSTITVTLNFGGSTSSTDFDLYLLDAAADTVLASSREDNPTSGDPSETITETLNPGTYFIGVDAFNGSGDYTLTIQ